MFFHETFTITNTNTETIDILVEKQWVGPAAESVTVKLFADGAEVASIDLSEKNGWKHTFTGLPKYDDEDGHEIVYTLDEVSIKGYSKIISGKSLFHRYDSSQV